MARMKPRTSNTRLGKFPNAGFTLIEVFVAFLILSYGLLGLAYLQTRSVQYGNESQNRTEINTIVADMIDRMRANQVQATSDEAFAYTTGLNELMIRGSACEPDSAGLDDDLLCFYHRLEEATPTSNFQITTEDLDGDTITESFRIWVYWSDQRLSQGGLHDGEVESLITEEDCAVADRTWSSTLNWPDPDRKDPKLCLVSHSWDFELWDFEVFER